MIEKNHIFPILCISIVKRNDTGYPKEVVFHDYIDCNLQNIHNDYEDFIRYFGVIKMDGYFYTCEHKINVPTDYCVYYIDPKSNYEINDSYLRFIPIETDYGTALFRMPVFGGDYGDVMYKLPASIAKKEDRYTIICNNIKFDKDVSKSIGINHVSDNVICLSYMNKIGMNYSLSTTYIFYDISNDVTHELFLPTEKKNTSITDKDGVLRFVINDGTDEREEYAVDKKTGVILDHKL